MNFQECLMEWLSKKSVLHVLSAASGSGGVLKFSHQTGFDVHESKMRQSNHFPWLSSGSRACLDQMLTMIRSMGTCGDHIRAGTNLIAIIYIVPVDSSAVQTRTDQIAFDWLDICLLWLTACYTDTAGRMADIEASSQLCIVQGDQGVPECTV